MCGRLDQHDVDALTGDFSWAGEFVRRQSAKATYDARPGSQRPVLYLEEGKLIADARFWGYKGKNAPPAATRPVPNARLDKLLGPYWGRLARGRRLIVPANAFYEWTPGEPKKRRWHIHRADGAKLYMAGITLWQETEVPAQSGFVIVTSASEGSMVDLHARAPVVFTWDDAVTWLDPDLSADKATQLAQSVALGPERFAWFEVSNTAKDGMELAQPLG